MVNFHQKKSCKYILVGMILLISFALLLTGCSSSGGGDDEDEPPVKTTVENIDELNDNINLDTASIDFANDISGDAEVTSRTDDLLLNLDANQLTGNFLINQSNNSSAWSLVLKNGTIDGDLTIDDPALSFTLGDNVTITGTTEIINVSDSSFNNEGEIEDVNISDDDGATFNNKGKINGNVEISSDGGEAVKLKGTIENDINIAGNGTKVRVTAEASINKIVVSNDAENVIIEKDESSEDFNIDGDNENFDEITILERVPKLDPSGGTYSSPQEVEISSSEDNDTIYYTLDGSEPMSDSDEYTDPLQVEETTTVKAKIINTDEESEVVTEKYIITDNSISGKVDYSGGTDNVKVVLISNDNIDDIESSADVEVAAGPQTVESDGSYSFNNLDSGDYYAVAFQDQNDNDELDFYDSINEPSEPFGSYIKDGEEHKISISDGDNLENIDIKLDDPKSNFITGKVDNISDTAGETYALLVDSSKELAVLDPAEADQETTIDSENRYVFDDVGSGDYYILAYNDQNGDKDIGADLFDKDPDNPAAEPLGLYGGYPKEINYTDTSQGLEGHDITISKKMLAVLVMNYDQENDTSIPLADAEVSLFNADKNESIVSTDNLFETTLDGQEIAFAFFTGLNSDDNYYLQGTHSDYRGTLSSIFNFSKYDIIATELELFTEEYVSNVFDNDNNGEITSNDALILAVIEEDSDVSDEESLSNKSVSLEGPVDYSSTENSEKLGYLASDGQYLDYDLDSFKTNDDGDRTFVVGVKKAEPGKYDIYLEDEAQPVDNIYTKEGFLTFIYDYVN